MSEIANCLKTFQKAVGCAEPAKNKIDNYSAGRFIAKALQRNPLAFCYRISKHITKATLGDIACYP